MSAPLISVVMANYNGAAYLADAIASLQCQTYSQWELLFIDDASHDDSIHMAQCLAADDSRISVIAMPANGGPGAARNEALRRARGAWVSIFDSDDLMHPERLERLLKRAEADTAKIVADDMLVFSDNPERAKSFLPPHWSDPRWIGLSAFIDSNRTHSRVPDLGFLKPLIRSDLIHDANIRYDEKLRIGEDYELMVHLLMTGERLRLEPAALYFYRKHAASTSHRISVEQLIALIEANTRLSAAIDSKQADTGRALQRRGRSLNTMLMYEKVIGLLKTGNLQEAACISMRTPQIWPLLTRPVTARVGRLWTATKQTMAAR